MNLSWTRQSNSWLREKALYWTRSDFFGARLTCTGPKQVMTLETAEHIGYQDAMRQVHRSIARRIKSVEEELQDAAEEEQALLNARLDELQHVIQIVESLHR